MGVQHQSALLGGARRGNCTTASNSRFGSPRISAGPAAGTRRSAIAFSSATGSYRAIASSTTTSRSTFLKPFRRASLSTSEIRSTSPRTKWRGSGRSPQSAQPFSNQTYGTAKSLIFPRHTEASSETAPRSQSPKDCRFRASPSRNGDWLAFVARVPGSGAGRTSGRSSGVNASRTARTDTVRVWRAIARQFVPCSASMCH